MRFLKWLGASVLLAALATTQAQARDLKIAAWNIEQLAERNGNGCRPRQDADYALARRYARMLDADIIAVQEIESVAALARVFDPDKYSFEISNQNLRAGYECDRNDPSSNKSTAQRTGFAIRKGIAYERNPDFEALDVSNNKSLRSGVDITVVEKRPVRLLSVHLKAICPSQPLTSDKRDCQILLKQQPILEEQWMEQRYKAGEAFIVLGDFNRHLLMANDEFWRLTNDSEPKGLNLTSIVGKREAICDAKYPNRIDHIVVDERAKALVKGDTFMVMTYTTGEMPSDHCPISAVIRLN